MTIEQNVARGKAVSELLELGESLCRDGGWDIASFWTAVSVGAADRAGIRKDADFIPERPAQKRQQRLSDNSTLDWPKSKFNGYRLLDIPDWWWKWFLKQDWCDEWPDLVEYANVID